MLRQRSFAVVLVGKSNLLRASLGPSDTCAIQETSYAGADGELHQEQPTMQLDLEHAAVADVRPPVIGDIEV